jgi:hypothetical protein
VIRGELLAAIDDDGDGDSCSKRFDLKIQI